VVAGMTTKNIKIVEPFEVFFSNTAETGLDEPSKLKLNYPRTVDKERLKEKLGVANPEIMEQEIRLDKYGHDYLILRKELETGKKYELIITTSQRGHQLLVDFTKEEEIFIW
ncbi:1123_t:CDS:2, partial [Racocetra fulgida]